MVYIYLVLSMLRGPCPQGGLRLPRSEARDFSNATKTVVVLTNRGIEWCIYVLNIRYII